MTEEERDFIKTFFNLTPTEKATVVARMHNSFNFAFAVVTLLASALVLRKDGFKPDEISWVILNLSIPLLGHFFIRTCKDYLNQIRFSHLQKVCSSSLAGVSPRSYDEIWAQIKLYYIDWTAPTSRFEVIRKSMTEHGFLILLIPIFLAHVYVGWFLLRQNPYMWLTLIGALVLTAWDMSYGLTRWHFVRYTEADTMKGLH